jgi:serine phosphatase RsbU (regulator of sigma subunit)
MRPGLPLGVERSARYTDTTALDPVGRVVLFTDGLVERRARPIDDGLELLRSVLDELAAEPLDTLCDVVMRDLGADARDDVCLLASGWSNDRMRLR